MRFSDAFLDDIRARVPISDVVGRRVAFDRKKSQPSKGDFWGCCPFHGEKTPSFHCEDRKGRYYCFGCQAKGDHFRFLTELEGLSFPEAVERLAAEAGLDMPAADPQAAERAEKRASLHDVMAMAAAWFTERLHASEGAKARAYLRDRGLSPAVQKRFGIGYAPAGRSNLKEYLGSKGVSPDALAATGLVVHGDDIPVPYDRFRERVMFPIQDTRGRVIAFGGRALSPDVPAKYLNSPETELFSKGRVLYNHTPARGAASETQPILAVEGYMDVIALAAFGFDQAVAPLGTALTEHQLALLWRVSPEPILCFDGDEAGMRAAGRAAELALERLEPGRSLRFAILPGGQDPDDLLRAEGREAMQAVLDGARPLADMVWSRETGGGTFDTPERRAQLERRMDEVARSIRDENVRRHYAQDFRERLAGFFGSAANDAQRRGSSGQRGQARAPFAPSRGSGGRVPVSDALAGSALVRRRSEPSLREAVLVGTILNHPEIGFDRFDAVASLRLRHEGVARVLQVVVEWLSDGGNEDDPRGSLDAHLDRHGMLQAAKNVRAQLRNSRIWQSLEDANVVDATTGWSQAHRLHTRALALTDELKAAEAAFRDEQSEETFERLARIRQSMASESDTEILPEGFGLLSGRSLRDV